MKFFLAIFVFPFSTFAKDIDGKLVFQNNCSACHGSSADGRGPAAVAIKDPKPRNFVGEPLKYGDSKEQIFQTITKGVPNTAMPPWAALSVEERRAVASYIFEIVEKRKKSESEKSK